MEIEAGRPRSARKILNTVFHALFIATLIASASLILRDSGTVPPHPMDQHFVETVNLHISRSGGQWTFQYPNLQNTGGITSSLIAGLYKLIVPTSTKTLNWHIRILAMVLYVGSSYLLIRSLITRPSLRILSLTLVAVSGYQFIQPSSELFAGGLFTLFLLSLHQRWPLILSACLLAMFSVCKVEMTVASAAITLFWWQWERIRGTRRAWRVLLYPVGLSLLLLAPAFLLEGANPLTGGRSFLAFSSAYTEMFFAHQFSSIKEAPLDQLMAIAIPNNFPGARSLLDVISRFPRLYFDYMGVSAVWSLPNLLHALKLLIVPFAHCGLESQEIGTSETVALSSASLHGAHSCTSLVDHLHQAALRHQVLSRIRMPDHRRRCSAFKKPESHHDNLMDMLNRHSDLGAALLHRHVEILAL